MDLEFHFPPLAAPTAGADDNSERRAPGSVQGVRVLIEACAELDQRNFAFHCEIVGDGPLRQQLEAAIAHHRLGKRVQLCGSLSQENVFSKLQDCDIFALAKYDR